MEGAFSPVLRVVMAVGKKLVAGKVVLSIDFLALGGMQYLPVQVRTRLTCGFSLRLFRWLVPTSENLLTTFDLRQFFVEWFWAWAWGAPKNAMAAALGLLMP